MVKTITKAEVIQEVFPMVKKPKKVYRFQCFYDNAEYPEFSSARFKNPDSAQLALNKFLLEDSSGIFGDLGRFDKLK